MASQLQRAGLAQRTGVPGASGPRGGGFARRADGGRVPRRPVLPRSGALTRRTGGPTWRRPGEAASSSTRSTTSTSSASVSARWTRWRHGRRTTPGTKASRTWPPSPRHLRLGFPGPPDQRLGTRSSAVARRGGSSCSAAMRWRGSTAQFPWPAARADERGNRGAGLPLTALGRRVAAGRRRGRSRRACCTSRPTAPFAAAVVEGRAPEPGLDVALEAHRLVDAAYRSAAAGGTPIAVR